MMQRFEEKVDRRNSHECWEWLGCKDKDGYGQFKYKGKQYLAHRAAMLIHGVYIPDGLCVLHHCDNPSCVNTEHLFIGTKKDEATISQVRNRRTWQHVQ